MLNNMFKFTASFESNEGVDLENGKEINWSGPVQKFIISLDSELFECLSWKEVVDVVYKLLNYLKIDSVSIINYEKLD